LNSETDQLRRAIELGEELLRITDAIGQPLAAVHIASGLDILNALAERELSRTEGTR
jgi:hypothetical protein